jgi:hypothetical protein
MTQSPPPVESSPPVASSDEPSSDEDALDEPVDVCDGAACRYFTTARGRTYVACGVDATGAVEAVAGADGAWTGANFGIFGSAGGCFALECCRLRVQRASVACLAASSRAIRAVRGAAAV